MPLSAIAGHRRVLTLLSRAIAHDTLPPSLLLAGPEGVGKRRAAVAAAEALNCLKPSRPLGATGAGGPGRGAQVRRRPDTTDAFEIDACGTCDACRRMARGIHPDVIVVEPGETGTIKIEQVRDVVDAAGYRPFEGRRRVVIIDDAEAMAPAAQSALLKTLEEPPSATVFLLVTAMPDALLPTVRSRCPVLRFSRLTAADVAHVLVRDHEYTAADAQAAAADADGSVGAALAMATVDLAGAREMARRLLQRTARGGDASSRMEAARQLTAMKGATPAREREQLALCLRSAAALLRDLGILAAQADSRMLANADLEPALRPLAQAYDSERSMRAFLAVDRALTALERNASPKVVADWLVLNL
jgi:DNA polymerase-3 subunit delta'